MIGAEGEEFFNIKGLHEEPTFELELNLGETETIMSAKLEIAEESPISFQFFIYDSNMDTI